MQFRIGINLGDVIVEENDIWPGRSSPQQLH
jgi:class 3 adenylate cyclase